MASTPTALGGESMAAIPQAMDSWWGPYADLGVLKTATTDSLDDQSMEQGWAELETWWDTYSKTRRDDIAELDRLLKESNVLWDRRDGPFDADPLSVEIDTTVGAGRPLTPGREEDWSDWLAQLLRADSGEFHRELFGEPFDAAPQRVEREAHFPNPSGKDRYADILAHHGSVGISIEVKIGDTHLKKTTDTTGLIEDQHYGDWRHYLLLPEDDLWAVHESFDVDGTAGDGERGTIPSAVSEEIEILYWSDVSRALRTVLIDGNAQTPHWAASAYLFCARIEHDRLGFTPQPIIDRIGAATGKVQSFRSVSVVIGKMEAQSEYLKTFIETTHE